MVDQQKYIIENKDGTIIIVSHLLGSINHPTIEDVINSWGATMRDNVLTITPIDDTFVFPDREFRNAWIKDGDQIGHDLEIAKNIAIEKVREVRDPLLKNTDGEFITKLSKGESTSDVEVTKVVLRDVTEELKSTVFETIEQLKVSKEAALDIMSNLGAVNGKNK